MQLHNRRYTSFRHILERLRDEVRLGSLNGTVQLPSITTLAQRYGTSRNTVRKALESLCAAHELERSGYKNYIYQTYGDLSKAGRIIFIAESVGGVFKYPALEHFWNVLQSMLLRKNANVELLLISEPRDFSRAISPSNLPDVIITSFIDASFALQLQQFQRSIPVFGILEQHASVLNNVISLDNREVGRLAARHLLKSGCSAPCAVWVGCFNPDFTERAAGFHDELVKHGVSGYSDVFWVRNGSATVSEYIRQLRWCADNGFDGVFMLSDEMIGDIIEDMINDGTIPGKMRIVTVDSTNEARRHIPSVTCIGHANEKVALALFDTLSHPVSNLSKPVRIRITPGIFPGDLDSTTVKS